MKSDKIKINFLDFWSGFDPHDNFIANSIQKIINVEIDTANPEIIFFSDFGIDNFNFNNCTRVYISGENKNLKKYYYDYSIDWRYSSRQNHFRLPLWMIYILYRPHWQDILNSECFEKQRFQSWRSKSKLCCMVVSNPNNTFRNEFYKKLSNHIPIDSGGRLYNNIGRGVDDKMQFINDYKFVLAFENSSVLGYTTEKIIEPFISNCIPIYWGNKDVDLDFRSTALILVNENTEPKEIAKRILKIANSEKLSKRYFSESIFSRENALKYHKDGLSLFLEGIIINRKNNKYNEFKRASAMAYRRIITIKNRLF